MGVLSYLRTVLSIITFLQNMGSTIGFSFFDLHPMLKKWGSALKNFISMIENPVLGYINAHDFRAFLTDFVMVISGFSLGLSFIVGLDSNKSFWRIVICICSCLPTFFSLFYEWEFYYQVITAFTTPLILFALRMALSKYLGNPLEDYLCNCKRKSQDNEAESKDSKKKSRKLTIENIQERNYEYQRELLTKEPDRNFVLNALEENLHIKEPHNIMDKLKMLFSIVVLCFAFFNPTKSSVLFICFLMGFMLFLFGIFGSCKLTRAAKITNKIGFNRIFLLLFTYALNALYIPILDYFIKIVYNTGVTCPEGYYWGVYRGKDTFLKADGHCIPCGYTLKQKYPGIESFLNDFVQPNSNNFTYSLFTKFLSYNPGILNETYDALNYTMDGLNESSNMCPHLCSGSFIRIMKDQTSIYFDFETKRYFMFFICWVIAFVLLVIPVLYYLLIYRARKEFKTLVAYGDNKDDRWECLLERVETVGVTHLKDYNYSNPYFAVFKIVYNFLVLLVTTLANLAHPHIITCLPIVHITMIVFLTLRKPYLSKWNNYSEIALSVLNLIIGILASVNLFSDVNQVFNTVIVLIADFLGVASEIGSAIIESYEKSKITDPTIMNEKEIQEFHPLIFDEDEEQGILEPLINEEEDSEDCLCGCLRERKVPKLMQYEPDNRPEISLKDLNPVESGVQLFNDAQPERSGEIRKRLQNLYIFYDILIDGAELSILTRFLRLLGVFGLAVSTPIINVKSVRFSCINYGSWF